MTKTLIDEDLIKRLKNGDQNALREIEKKLHKKLHELSISFTENAGESEEVVQDALLALWDKRDSLTLNAGLDVIKYLSIVVRNASINKAKSTKRQDQFKQMFLFLGDRKDEMFVNNIPFEELLKTIHSEIKHLPGKPRDVLTLFFIQGMNHKEISTRLNMLESTVRSNKARGINKIRQLLLKKGLLSFLG